VRLALVAAAAIVAATLADDTLAHSALSHERAPAVYAVAALLAAALLTLAPRVRSRTVSLGAGIAAGGAIATLVTGIAWSGGVPNPLVRGGVAFNLADVAIGAGDALLIGGALLHAARNRHRLRERI
jgi:lipoprotein signal peptidase